VSRSYQADSDGDAVLRIYREAGWVSKTEEEEATRLLIGSGRGSVAEIRQQAECFVLAHSGTLRYLDEDLPLSIVTGVLTGRVARQQGLARDLTAHRLTEEASAGAAVAILSVFEQGYYDQFGFGSGTTEHWLAFDPSLLIVPGKPRPPVRFTQSDGPTLHDARLRRLRGHGACSILAPEATRAEILWTENGFGLGYLDDRDECTHHIWCSAKGETGPFRVVWMAYRTRDQFLELLQLIRSLGDQVHSIRMEEPPQVQMQDFLRQPFKMRQITRSSAHENRMSAGAYWQARILDLDRCIASLRTAAPVRFNLVLTDPVTSRVPENANWRGIGGQYTISLGQVSSLEPGLAADLPIVRASVNAFTRFWLGVRSATELSWSDDLDAPQEMLHTLDATVRLPSPHPDWPF
jgi:hypothetical protein